MANYVTMDNLKSYNTQNVAYIDKQDKAVANAAKNYTDSQINLAKAYTDSEISDLIDSAPETLDTLKELADAIKDNGDAVTAINSAITDKADKTELASAIAGVQENFQAGVDSVYDAIVAKGATPASKSLSDVVSSIDGMSTAQYDWSDDGTTCTAIKEASDGSITEQETVTTEIEVISNATCTECGQIKATASFENGAFAQKIKYITTPKKGHVPSTNTSTCNNLATSYLFGLGRCEVCSGSIQGFYDSKFNLVMELSNEDIEKDYTSTQNVLKEKGIEREDVNYLIVDKASKIGNNFLNGCKTFRRIYISSSAPCTSIGVNAFANTKLLFITTENATEIKDGAFKNCTSLHTAVFGSALTTIGNEAFSGATSLTNVIIPDTVTSIGTNAFKNTSYILYNGSASGMPWGAANVVGGEPTFSWSTYSETTVPTVTATITKRYGSSYVATRTGVKIKETSCQVTSSTASLHYSVTFIEDDLLSDYTLVKTDSFTVTRTDNNVYHTPKSDTTTGKYCCKYHENIKGDSYGALYPMDKNGVENLCKWVFLDSVLYVNGTTPNFSMSNFSTPYQPWFSCRNYINKVKIGKNIKRVGNGAFEICPLFKEVEVDERNAYLGSISNFVYDKISNSILLSPYGKKNEDIVIPTDGEIIRGIGSNVFKSNQRIETLNIPSNIDIIYTNAFSSSSIKSTNLNNVKELGSNSFSGCSDLTSIDISPYITEVPNNCFSGCSGLTTVSFGKNVNKIGSNAFLSCDKLSTINFIPNSIVEIGDSAFSKCSSLTSIEIPEGVKTIGENCFSSCTQLVSVKLPNSIVNIGSGAFANCPALKTVTFPNDSRFEADGKLVYDGDRLVLALGATGNVVVKEGTTEICGGAFSGCKEITSISIPNTVVKIGNYAFAGCTGLTDITIPSSVTNLGDYVFAGCTGLTTFTIPSSIDSLGKYMFSNCTSLTTLTIPDNITSIGEYAFSGCKLLTTITIPNSVTTIGNYAFNSAGLTSITIPGNVKTLSSYLFNNCSSLTSVTLCDGITKIGDSAFASCSAITSITIPASVNIIGYYALPSNSSCVFYIYGRPNVYSSYSNKTYVKSQYYQYYKNDSYYTFKNLYAFEEDLNAINIIGIGKINTNVGRTGHYNVKYNVADNIPEEQKGCTWSVIGNATINETGLLTLNDSAVVGDKITVKATSTYNSDIVGTYEVAVVDDPVSSSIELNNQWVDSGTTIDGCTVYMSNASKGVDNALDRATVSFSGYTKATVYLRSYAEGHYDYALVGVLDAVGISRNSGNVVLTTQDRQSATQYYSYTFDTDGENHSFEVVYAKDSSSAANDDRGYFYVVFE